jgi:septal ring factor EnvC (AmiA/AmiB activator)
MHGSVPAWTGAVAAVGYILAQALGLDPAALTGKGQAHQVAAIEKNMDRIEQRMASTDARITGANARIRGTEQSISVLFERTDTAKEDRADIKTGLTDLNRKMSDAARTLVRIETKLDR